jgi:hypothetical protein
MMDNYFWFHQQEIYPTSHHVKFVYENSSLFGFTKEQIQKMFKLNKETLFEEGLTTKILFAELFKSGWMKITQNGIWIIECDSVKIRKDEIVMFFNQSDTLKTNSSIYIKDHRSMHQISIIKSKPE